MKMNVDFIIDKIKTGDFTGDKVIGWLNALATSNFMTPNENKVGDVYMHVIFKHPYVLLEQKENRWVCGLLTSNENCDTILCKAESRFFENALFVETLFLVGEPRGVFYGIYDNNKHIKKVLKKLRKTLKQK